MAPEEKIPVPLYHGTSSLFIDSIFDKGLGGHDPIKHWRLIEFANVLFPLVVEYLSHDDNYNQKIESFQKMAEQSTEAGNFQHGETYLSPSLNTAIRYATSKKYGSELLTYTLILLEGLLLNNVPGIRNHLYRKYPQIFNLLDISVAPILIEVCGVPSSYLLSEFGESPKPNILEIRRAMKDRSILEDSLQQVNFRLNTAIPSKKLTASLISVSQWDSFNPKYRLYEISRNA